MPRIILDRTELTQKFRLTLTIALARHTGTARDLLNPRITETAERNRTEAIRRIADLLTDSFFTSKHEVSRESMGDAGEASHARLRAAVARRDD